MGMGMCRFAAPVGEEMVQECLKCGEGEVSHAPQVCV